MLYVVPLLAMEYCCINGIFIDSKSTSSVSQTVKNETFDEDVVTRDCSDPAREEWAVEESYCQFSHRHGFIYARTSHFIDTNM
jgi:hypothetical protein